MTNGTYRVEYTVAAPGRAVQVDSIKPHVESAYGVSA